MNRLIKFIVGITVASVLLIVVTIASLPTLISSFGEKGIVRFFNQAVPGTLKFENLSIGWFSGLTINDFELSDPQGNPVITFKHLEADISPLDFINRKFKWGKLELSALDATIEMTPSGITNLQEALGDEHFPTKLVLKNPVSLSDVSISAELLGDEIKLEMTGGTKQSNITGGFNFTALIKEKQISLMGNISNFPVAVLDSIVAINEPEMAGLLPEMLGDSLTINVDQKQENDNHTFQFEATSPYLSANFKGQIIDGIITLDQPGTFSLDNSTSKLKNWNIKQFNGVKFQIEKMEIPVDFFSPGWKGVDPEDITLISDFTLQKLQYQTDETDVSLLNLTGKLEALKDVRNFTLEIDGMIEKDQTPVNFQLTSEFQKPPHINYLAQKLNQFTDFQMRIENLPTKALDKAFDTNDYFYNSLGNQVSIALRGNSQDYGALHFQLESDKIAIPKMKIQIHDVNSLNGDLSKMDVSGKFEIDQIIFRKESPDTTLSNLVIPWEYYGSSQKFNGNLSGKTASGGSFSGKAAVSRWGSPEGISLLAQFNGNEIPAHFFHFLTGKAIFSATFGPYINTDLNIKLQNGDGNTQVRLKGTEGYVTLNGKITKGILTLNEPLYLETTPSKELGDEVINEFAPPLAQLISGSAPITLSIDPKGFSMSLSKLDVSEIEILKGTIKLGKLNFRNQGDIKKIVRFLNAPKSEHVTIWFTPQYFHMHRGVIQLQRMDLLINDLNPLATWGKVDFPADRINVRIGFSGISLMNAFKLKNIERDVMLQVPLRGPINRAKVDLSTVTAQIGSYLAKKEGGPHGLLIGTVLDIANGKGKVPPPTTKPLPWQKLLDHQQVASQEDTPKPDKVKDLEKGAKELLKGLFE